MGRDRPIRGQGSLLRALAGVHASSLTAPYISSATKHSLRSQIADEEQALWRVYAQMGHRALELLSAGAIQDPALADLPAQVPPHQERIEELKRQVEELDRSLGGP